MTTTASIASHNSICAPRTSEKPKYKDPINLYFQHRFEENKEQKLAELKEKHEAGEISDFQYKIELQNGIDMIFDKKHINFQYLVLQGILKFIYLCSTKSIKT